MPQMVVGLFRGTVRTKSSSGTARPENSDNRTLRTDRFRTKTNKTERDPVLDSARWQEAEIIESDQDFALVDLDDTILVKTVDKTVAGTDSSAQERTGALACSTSLTSRGLDSSSKPQTFANCLLGLGVL